MVSVMMRVGGEVCEKRPMGAWRALGYHVILRWETCQIQNFPNRNLWFGRKR